MFTMHYNSHNKTNSYDYKSWFYIGWLKVIFRKFSRELIPAWPSALRSTFCSQDCLDIQNRNPYASYQEVLIKKKSEHIGYSSSCINPATWNPSVPAWWGMSRNSREVALSSASRDEFNLQILRHCVCNIWVSFIPPASFSRRWPLGYALCFWSLGLIITGSLRLLP